jgi:threonine aldolase
MAENTHNRGGGRIFPLADLTAIRALADELDLRVHIDGARLMNAAIASKTQPSTYGGLAHSLSLCLSKGLGAPVGSVIAGSSDFVTKAHRYRKMLGGGMRQAGIIAAGGLYALENNISRLADDHRRTRHFAERINTVDGLSVDLAKVETNIVMVDVIGQGRDAWAVQELAGEHGLAVLALNSSCIRAVFHLHISDDDVEAACEILSDAVS